MKTRHIVFVDDCHIVTRDLQYQYQSQVDYNRSDGAGALFEKTYTNRKSATDYYQVKYKVDGHCECYGFSILGQFTGQGSILSKLESPPPFVLRLSEVFRTWPSASVPSIIMVYEPSSFLPNLR